MRGKKSLLLILAILLLSVVLIGAELPVEKWLVAQAKVFKPPFTSGSFSLFDYSSLDIKSLWPGEGQKLYWDSQQSLTWEKFQAPGGKLSLSLKEGLNLVLAATYLDVPRWQKAVLLIENDSQFQIFLDGDLVGKGKETDLTLTRGKHCLLIASLQDQAKDGGLKISLQLEDKYKSMMPKVSTYPVHNITLLEAHTIPQARGVEVAPDGSRVAIRDSDGGLEIRSLPEGNLLQTIFLTGQISSFSWSPEGNRLAIVTEGEKRLCDLWLINLKDGSTKKLLSKIGASKTVGHLTIEGISQLNWLPDGKFITYTTAEMPPEKGAYELVDNFFDRWEGWKTKVYLWIASVESGTRHMITGGIDPYGWFEKALVSPDGKKVVFLNVTPSSVYPYRHEELWLVDILSGKSELISEIKTAMISDMVWSPDSTRLAVIAPYYDFPMKPSDMENYHTRWHEGIQLWDVSKKSYQYLTEPEFNPCVRSIWWNPEDHSLYFIALDRTVHRLYRFSPDRKDFSEVKLPFTNIEAIFGGNKSDWVVLQLAEIDKPSWLVSLNLETLESHKIWDKGQEFLSSIRLGKYEMFYCRNREGTKLDGWVYFPPDFDSKKKYPTIIHYYGGFSPKIQRLDGINHWLAGNGYVVYMLTPRGGWGYGQEFTDVHVSACGTVAGPDVIDAVKALIKAKPYVDPKRIGGFGASQGGFLGLFLVTKTDLFATVVAIAVISNLTSYFLNVLGQPNLDEIGLPGVFPWIRKDIYVDRSPVFSADKVNTPVLLMQGTADPWCEMIESDQMYSALKVQGKDVVQIRWIGEGHGVRKLSNRILFNMTRLEWFDKYLKDEPESWQERYNKSRR